MRTQITKRKISMGKHDPRLNRMPPPHAAAIACAAAKVKSLLKHDKPQKGFFYVALFTFSAVGRRFNEEAPTRLSVRQSLDGDKKRPCFTIANDYILRSTLIRPAILKKNTDDNTRYKANLDTSKRRRALRFYRPHNRGQITLDGPKFTD